MFSKNTRMHVHIHAQHTHTHTHTHLELALGERLVEDGALEVGAARRELKKKVGGVREKVALGGRGVEHSQQLCQSTQCG